MNRKSVTIFLLAQLYGTLLGCSREPEKKGPQLGTAPPLAQELLGLSANQLLGQAVIDPEWRFLREDGSAMPVSDYPASRVLATRQQLKGQVTGVRRYEHGTYSGKSRFLFRNDMRTKPVARCCIHSQRSC